MRKEKEHFNQEINLKSKEWKRGDKYAVIKNVNESKLPFCIFFLFLLNGKICLFPVAGIHSRAVCVFLFSLSFLEFDACYCCTLQRVKNFAICSQHFDKKIQNLSATHSQKKKKNLKWNFMCNLLIVCPKQFISNLFNFFPHSFSEYIRSV